jgi:hypothetical protein
MGMVPSNNPYEPIPVPEQPLDTTSRKLPGLLTVIAVLFCVFGALGLLSIPMMVLGLVMQAVMPQGKPTNPAEEIQQKIQGVADSLLIPNLAFAASNGVISGFLLATGIGIFRRRRWAPILGWRTSLAAIFLEIGRAVFGGYAAYLQFGVLGELPEPANAPFNLKDFMGWVFAGVLCFSAGYVLVKIAMYVVAMIQLQRPAHRGFFTQ